jgi:hypothetical protein
MISYIGGNRHHTIPHRFKDDRRHGDASADTQGDRGNGSRLYQVNICPRMVSIAEAERIRSERLRESRLRAAETMQRGLQKAAAERIEQNGL